MIEIEGDEISHPLLNLASMQDGERGREVVDGFIK